MLRVHDVGVTLLTSVFTGVHVGTTLKFLHGRVEHTTGGAQLTPQALLDLGDDATGAGSQWQFDADVGVLAVTGPIRRGRRRQEPARGRVRRRVRRGPCCNAAAAAGAGRGGL